ncbi:MAG: phage portal protein [Ruminococcaceae bacterium]|nr:phage portal protein [Oscillospiraceae bacterium]
MMELETSYAMMMQSIEKVLGKKVLVSDKMKDAMILWDKLYRCQAPWQKEEVKSLCLAPTVVSELACQTTLDFSSVISGSERADYLNESVYQETLADIRQCVEYACACGGLVFKPYVDNGKLAVEYVRANAFFPIEVDCRGKIISAVFTEQRRKGLRLFTRLEVHTLEKEGVRTRNLVLEGGAFVGGGRLTTLREVEEWADLAEEVLLTGVKQPLFSYLKMPIANTVDPQSALGVSIYSRAVGLMEEADLQFSRLLWEYEGGELAVDASVDALLMENGDIKMPGLKKRLFRALDVDTGGGDLYSVFAPPLRDESYLNGLMELLMRVEDLCGLARGTFSNLNGSARTATELNILRQRSYSTVTDIQKAVERSLRDLVKALETMATVFDLVPEGHCDITFSFDDSVVTDRASQFEEMQLLVSQGILDKWELRSWYLGETEEQAKKNLPVIEKE